MSRKSDQSKYSATNTIFKYVNISAGYHSLFQNDKQEIYGCGYTFHGTLGLFSAAPQIEVCILNNHPSNIIQISSGYYHSLFLDSQGNVFGIGYNQIGNLGLGNNDNQKMFNQIPNIPPIRIISCVGHSSFLIDFDGNLWSFGSNKKNQLSFQEKNIDTPLGRNIPIKHHDVENISQVASGCCGNHFLVKNFDDKIFVGGDNTAGQLGTGDATLTEPKYKEIHSDYFSIWGKTQTNRAKSARK